jgi:hypothetical protein
MPNVTLTHTFSKKELNKANILKKAWEYIRKGVNRKDAFKKAWYEFSKLSVTFYTNAKPEDIQWTIKSCQKNGEVKKDLLRKWDSNMIIHPLDWVSYHLRRNGFIVSEPLSANIYRLSYEIPKL